MNSPGADWRSSQKKRDHERPTRRSGPPSCSGQTLHYSGKETSPVTFGALRSSRGKQQGTRKSQGGRTNALAGRGDEILLGLTGTPTGQRPARHSGSTTVRSAQHERHSQSRDAPKPRQSLDVAAELVGRHRCRRTTYDVVLTHLEQCAAEPCAPSTFQRTRAALASGLPQNQRFGQYNCCEQAKSEALKSSTHTKRASRANTLNVRGSSRTPGRGQGKLAVLHCYAFWTCLEAWLLCASPTTVGWRLEFAFSQTVGSQARSAGQRPRAGDMKADHALVRRH